MELSSFERDALKEIGEMSAGATSGSIAKLTGRRTTHVTSQTHEVPARELAQALGVSGVGVAGAATRLQGDVRGAMLVAWPEESAREVADLMLGKRPGTSRTLGPLEQSALKELANVATGTYLKTFYNFLGFEVDYGVPTIAAAGWEPMVKYTFLGTTPGAEKVWAVASTLEMGMAQHGRLFLLLDASAVKRVIEAIHKKSQG